MFVEVADTEKVERENEAIPRIDAEGLRILHDKKLAGPELLGDLNPIIVTPIYNFSWVPERLREGVEERFQKFWVKTESIIPRKPGDVMLNLTTGEKTVVDKVGKGATLTKRQAQGGEIILVRNGNVPSKIVWHKEGRREVRDNYDGRVASGISGHFMGAIHAVEGFTVTLNGEVIDRREQLFQRQSLSAITTLDDKLILPKIEDLGMLIVTDPSKLADFLFKNKVFSNAEEANIFGLNEICWLLVHGIVENEIAKLSYDEIMEDPESGLVKKDIEVLILAKIDLVLRKVGFERQLTQRDISNLEEYWPGLFKNVPEEFEGKDPELIATKVEHDLGHPHVTKETILELNPQLKGLKDIRVPPRFSFSGFDRFRASLAWEIDETQALVEKTGLQYFRETFGYDVGTKGWVNTVFREAANPDSILSNRFRENFVSNYFPKVEKYWAELTEKYGKKSPERKRLLVSY